LEINKLDSEAIIKQAGDVLTWEANVLRQAVTAIDHHFVDAVRLILARVPPGKVAVLGVGKSGHIGNKIAATLASTGTPSFFVHPTEAGHGDLGMIAAGDVALMISYSGKSSELAAVTPYFRRYAIPIIAITGDMASPLAKSADLVLNAKVEREACPLGLAPTASTTLTLALGDALAMCLLQARGFKPEDFGATHPHGSLGRKLLVHVSDVMVSGPEMPVVRCGMQLRNCLHEMTRGTLGLVAVVDEHGVLAGIFTDGDLRRVLESDMDSLAAPIDKYMKAMPKAIQPDRLAVDAVELMHRHKINALLVVDAAGKLVGALNMRLLLQAGVI
jgi:arabinose-5-phosphate isomerase